MEVLDKDLVSKQMIHERGSGISVSADGDAFVNAVRVSCNDVVELVAHSARPTKVYVVWKLRIGEIGVMSTFRQTQKYTPE